MGHSSRLGNLLCRLMCSSVRLADIEGLPSLLDLPHYSKSVFYPWRSKGLSCQLMAKRDRSAADQDSQPEFAKAWLAYHGFSSEFARGPQTPNLFCAHEKWCKLMPESSSRILFSWIHFPSMMIHHLTSDFQQPGTKQTYRGQPAPTSPRISREPMLPLSPLSLSSRVRPHSRSAPAAIMTSSSVLSPAASLPPPNTPRGSSVSTQHSINDLRPFPIIFFATSLHCGFPP
ncbi:hypothetical protein V8E52_010588 [Russula decolorans]